MSVLLSILLQTAAVVAPAPAPLPVGVVASVGDGVRTSDGVTVGRVVAVDEDTAIVRSGTDTLPLPRSVASRAGGVVTLSMSKAELDAATAERERATAASRTSLLRAGTQVIGADGEPIGVVEAASGSLVTLRLLPTGMVSIPAHSFVGVEGSLVMAQTRAQILAMVAAKPAR